MVYYINFHSMSALNVTFYEWSKLLTSQHSVNSYGCFTKSLSGQSTSIALSLRPSLVLGGGGQVANKLAWKGILVSILSCAGWASLPCPGNDTTEGLDFLGCPHWSPFSHTLGPVHGVRDEASDYSTLKTNSKCIAYSLPFLIVMHHHLSLMRESSMIAVPASYNYDLGHCSLVSSLPSVQHWKGGIGLGMRLCHCRESLRLQAIANDAIIVILYNIIFISVTYS